MKKTIALLLVLCMAFALCACGGSSAPAAPAAPAAEPAAPAASGSDAPAAPEAPAAEEIKPVTLTYSTHVNSGAVSAHGIEMIEERVNEILGGDYLTIDYYYSNTLGTGATMLDDVKSGVTDIGNIMVSSNVSVLPMCALFQTPGAAAFLSCESAASSFRDYLNELQPAELEDLIVLDVIATGPGSIVTNFEAHSMADLSGRMIRGSATTADTLTAWGAKPVTLEWGECYEAMRNNLIEGIYTNAGAPADNNFDDVVKYHIYAPWYNECELFAMSKEGFYNLQPAMQEAILQAADEVFDEYFMPLQDIAIFPFPMFERYFAAIDGIIFFPQEEVDKMTDAISATGAAVKAQELDAQGLPGTEALALIKELADKYNAIYDGSTYKDALLGFGATVIE